MLEQGIQAIEKVGKTSRDDLIKRLVEDARILFGREGPENAVCDPLQVLNPFWCKALGVL